MIFWAQVDIAAVFAVELRDLKLYRAEFGTFEDYCKERWGIAKRTAYQLMDAAEVVSTMVDKGMPAPTNERQARPLSRLEPEEQHRRRGRPE